MNLATKPIRFSNIRESDSRKMTAIPTNIANPNRLAGRPFTTLYESLKGAVQETLHRSRTNSMALARLGHTGALNFNADLDELEKMVADRIGRLKAAVNEGEAAVSREAQHAAQMNERLRASVGMLEAKLKETEDAVREKDSGRHKTKDSLTAKVRDLQGEIKKKNETLEKQENDITDLKNQIEFLIKRTTQLEGMIEQAKTDATGEAQRAEHVAETSKSKITVLEAQLTRTEEMVREKESAIKALEQEFTAKIQHLESHLTNKDKLLVGRVKQVSELTSQLKALEDGVRKMSSFFRSTESLSAIEPQSVGAVLPVVQPHSAEEPAVPQLKNPTVPRDKTDETTPETLSAEFFRRVTDELSDILGPMASMIIRHDAIALGESMDNFPKARVTELLDSITKEVSDEKLKNAFLKRLGF